MIKKGDKVLILTGKDKGRQENVIKVISDAGRVVVNKVNIVKKHKKAPYRGAKGEIIEKPLSVAISNVQIVCPKCNKATRIGKKILESGSKVRICKKCKEEI